MIDDTLTVEEEQALVEIERIHGQRIANYVRHTWQKDRFFKNLLAKN